MTWIHHYNYNNTNYISITATRNPMIPITIEPFVKTLCFWNWYVFFSMFMLYVLHNRTSHKTSTVARFNVWNTDVGNVVKQKLTKTSRLCQKSVKQWLIVSAANINTKNPTTHETTPNMINANTIVILSIMWRLWH